MTEEQFEKLLKALTAIALGIQKLNEKINIANDMFEELPEIVEAIDRVANSI